MAEVRGQWPAPGFTRYHRWRPHVCIKSGCILVWFTALSGHQFTCKGNVICRPCASHDAQICVTPSHRHTDEVIYMGLKDCSEGLDVELTFRSLGALLSIFVTRSDTWMVLLPFTAFCVAEVREVEVSHCCWIFVFSDKGACLWSQKMKDSISWKVWFVSLSSPILSGLKSKLTKAIDVFTLKVTLGIFRCAV